MLNAIFDFNGTMFFDETFQEKAWQQYMTDRLGRRITPEEFRPGSQLQHRRYLGVFL
ncbi:MAG: hypothetical protein ACLUGI_13135 [Subdoligranulum sp.]